MSARGAGIPTKTYPVPLHFKYVQFFFYIESPNHNGIENPCGFVPETIKGDLNKPWIHSSIWHHYVP